MTDRPRLPRLTVGRVMGPMVPAAAHLALARALPELFRGLRLHAWDGDAMACQLALAGLAVAAYRRASFLGWVVQLTTSPLAVLALFRTAPPATNEAVGLIFFCAWIAAV